MFRKVGRKLSRINRRRHMTRLRREFARYGYPVDDLDDSNIEAAMRWGEHRLADVPLTSQSIFFALRRLSRVGELREWRRGPRRRTNIEIFGGGNDHGY